MLGYAVIIALCGLNLLAGCANLPAHPPGEDWFASGTRLSAARHLPGALGLFAAGAGTGLALAWWARRRGAGRGKRWGPGRLLPEDLNQIRAALTTLEEVSARCRRQAKLVDLALRRRGPPRGRL